MKKTFLDKIKQSFKSDRFKYGTFGTITALFIIGLLIIVNLVFSSLNIKWDFTENKTFSLSKESINILENLNENIEIYPLFSSGDISNDSIKIKEILEQYKKYSDKISIDYKDPVKSPDFVSQFKGENQNIYQNSIIVKSGKRFKIVSPEEYILYSYNEQYQPIATDYNVDSAITNAILYVTKDTLKTIYTITGHDEQTVIPETYLQQLETLGIGHKTLNLLTLDTTEIPEDAVGLIITTPAFDYPEVEIEILSKYLQNNGTAFIAASYSPNNLPNFYNLLESYGISINNNFVFEEDINLKSPSTGLAFNTIIQNHESTTSFLGSNYPGPFFLQTTSIDILSERKKSLNITPIITTTEKSYSKFNPESAIAEKEPADKSGPFNLGVAIEDSSYSGENNYHTKIILVSSDLFLNEELNSMSGSLNALYFFGFMDWLVGIEELTYIPPKSINSLASNEFTESQFITGTVFSIIIIPLIIILVGFVIWLKRRNK